MRYGIFGGGVAAGPVDRVVAAAARAEADGFDSFFMPQIFELDAMTTLAVVGREVPRITLGTAVVPIFPRHPLVTAQQALTVQGASTSRFVLGIGLSHQIVIENMLGYSFDRPLRSMREYLEVLMPLLHDRRVDVTGETVSGHVSVDIASVVAPLVLIAALGTRMLELAGHLADGTVTWMTGPETLARHTVPTINAAATAAGRPAPRIGAALPVMVSDDPAAARAAAEAEFAIYSQLPSYRAMLDREGAEGPGAVALVGTEAQVRSDIERVEAAGVTDFIGVEYGTPNDRARTRDLLCSLL